MHQNVNGNGKETIHAQVEMLQRSKLFHFVRNETKKKSYSILINYLTYAILFPVAIRI